MASRTAIRSVVISLGIGVGAMAGLESMLIPVLPDVQRELGTDASGISWALTTTLIAAAVATPILGRVADMFGRRRIFLLMLLTVAAASIMAALAPNLAVLLGSRVLQGVGAAIVPVAYSLVREAVPMERLSWGIGILTAFVASGAAFGTVFGGALAQLVTWRGAVLIPLVAVVVSALLVRWIVPADAHRSPGRINVAAAILLSTWLVCLLIPFTLAGSLGWTSPIVLGLLAAAAAGVAAWVTVELRSVTPLVDVRLLRLPGVWNMNVAAILIGATMYATWAYFARMLQEPEATGYGLGLTAAHAGFVMLPMLALVGAAGLLIHPLTRWLSLRAQFAIAATMVASGTLSVAIFHDNVVEFALAGALFGFGLGITNGTMASIVVQSVPAQHSGVAAGVNVNFRKIGQASGVAVATSIVTGGVLGIAGEPTESGYVLGFVVLAVLAFLAVPAALIGRRTTRPLRPADGDLVLENLAETV